MVGGTFISIMFGINKSFFFNKIQTDLLKNEKIIKITETVKREAKLKKEASKNWRYYQRFHFHATAICSMSLAILIFLNFISAPLKLSLVTSNLIGVGGFLYPFVWLFAAIYGPIMGRDAAKEAFSFFAYGCGLFLVGLVLLLFMVVRYPLDFKKS
jgi:hypothetical protein